MPGFADREALTFTVGHRVLFCCVLDQDSPLPRSTLEALPARLFREGTIPDWIVIFWALPNEYWEAVKEHYELAAQPDVYYYPTQRPELNFHTFEPLPMQRGVSILRRRGTR